MILNFNGAFMMKVKKVCFIVVVLTFLAQNANCEIVNVKHKVGVILGLSGIVSSVASSIQNGILLSDKENDNLSNIEFIFEDDQFIAKNSISAAEKLINFDKVEALISFGGNTSLAISEIAEKNRIPLISITSLSRIGRNKQYVYSMYMSEHGQVESIVKTLSTLNADKVSIVTTMQEALLNLKEEFLKTNAGKVLINEELQPADIDLKMISSKIMLTKTKAVILLLLPPQISILSKQLRKMGFDGQFIGGTPMASPDELKASNGALIGALLPGPIDEKNHFPKKFFNETGVKFVPESLYAYDIARLLIKSLAEDDVNSYLSKLDSYEGLAGKYLKNAENQFEVPVVMKKVSDDYSLIDY